MDLFRRRWILHVPCVPCVLALCVRTPSNFRHHFQICHRFAHLSPVNVPDTFSTPLVPLVPLLAVTVNLFMVMRLPIDALYRVVIWTAIGVVIYAAYGIRNSKLNSTTNSTSVNTIA